MATFFGGTTFYFRSQPQLCTDQLKIVILLLPKVSSININHQSMGNPYIDEIYC